MISTSDILLYFSYSRCEGHLGWGVPPHCPQLQNRAFIVKVRAKNALFFPPLKLIFMTWVVGAVVVV